MSNKIPDFFPEDDFDAIKNIFQRKDIPELSCELKIDKNASTNNKNKKNKKKHISRIITTKFESFLMFFVIIMFLGIIFICMQNNMTKLSNATNEKINSLETQIRLLQTEIQTLETKLELYITDDNQKPIDITLNIDGNKAEISYDSENNDNQSAEDVNANNNSESENLPEDFDTRPFLGVGFSEETLNTTHTNGLPVDYVYQYSPAYFAGMDSGDIIISINGTKINSKDDLDSVISILSAKDEIKIEFGKVDKDGNIQIQKATQELTYRGNFELEN